MDGTGNPVQPEDRMRIDWTAATRATAAMALIVLAMPDTSAAQSGAAAETATPIPAINGKLRTIRFYETGDEPLASADRGYVTKFEKARTRRIGTELTFDLPAPGRVVAFKVACTYMAADSALGTLEIPFEAQADWTAAFHGSAWGWPGPRNWKPGVYRATCSSDGVRVAEGQFEIVDGPPDLPSFNARLSRMRLFASGSDVPPRDQRKYNTTFASAEVQYMHVEIELVHPAPGRVVNVPINCLVIRADGTITASLDLTFNGIAAEWTSAVRSNGWGNATAGAFWKPGRYRVACTGDGNLLGQLTFEVT